mgnify:CR=1 FL=1
MTSSRVIGKNNDLPWHLSADLRRVKDLTMGHAIVMGRKTADSIVARIGKGLPGRTNIVITRNGDYDQPDFTTVGTIDEALQVAEGDTFIFGGAKIYELAMPYVDKIYMTIVHADIKGDVYFPELDTSKWHEVYRESHKKDEKNEYDYDFVELERQK